jgi:hypothetical protein
MPIVSVIGQTNEPFSQQANVRTFCELSPLYDMTHLRQSKRCITIANLLEKLGRTVLDT